MALTRTVVALLLGAGLVSGFTPTSQLPTTQSVARPTTSSLDVVNLERNSEMFEEGMNIFAEEYPGFARWGWGPTVHAEKWNGRHAMFGWFFICCTAYFKGHGMIPDATTMLNFKEWGSLALISAGGTKEATFISNERAIILAANIHCFMVGVFATIAPLPFSDPLLLDPDQEGPYERAMNTKPYGVIPDMSFDKWGLTETAEIMNGRMAMFGLIMLLGASLVDGKNMIDVVNEWVGSPYF